MTDKNIKNEQWYVKDLISKILNKKITKPKFQRRKKWDIIPSNDTTANERSYIEFLFKTKNSVHAITFGHETSSESILFSNIDGNNRINAIQHFMTNPFDIFRCYLVDLFKLLDTIPGETVAKIKDHFTSVAYAGIINYTRLDKYLKSIHKYDEYYPVIKDIPNNIDDEIEKIQKKLRINEVDNFDSNVKISVNLFEGYNTDELSETFEEINKFNSKLTETELLACRLFNTYNFDINDNIFKANLENSIINYYQDKSSGEVLECYKYNRDTDSINAHDFIVGFQYLLSNTYEFIEKTEADGLSLFFKLYKAIYGSYEETFTTENVNDFITKIKYSCEILNQTMSNIFTKKIIEKLFNNSCTKKIKTLQKNNLFMLISSIIGYNKQNTDDDIIIKNLERCLLYHFFVSDVKDKDTREDFKNHDSITYRAGGAFIENKVKNLLSNPSIISNKLNTKLFNDLFKTLFNDTNNPDQRKLENGNNKNDKRRPLRFFEKTIMFYYYKAKMPTNMLNNDFSIEHIFPNSSDWDGNLDKDRTGNLIPIICSMNSSRGNRHINNYQTSAIGKEFFKFIKDVIPFDEYDNIIYHHEKKPKIINNDLYNKLCDKNEKIYKDCFVTCLFPKIQSDIV